jgi:hypothetical protein
MQAIHESLHSEEVFHRPGAPLPWPDVVQMAELEKVQRDHGTRLFTAEDTICSLTQATVMCPLIPQTKITRKLLHKGIASKQAQRSK